MTQNLGWILFIIFLGFSAFRRKWGLYLLFLILPFYALLITFSQHFFHTSGEILFSLRLIKEGILLGILVSLIYSWIRNRSLIKEKINFYLSDIFILIYLIILISSGLIFHSSLAEIFFGLRYDFFFFFSYFIFRLYFIFSKDNEFQTIIKIIFTTAIIVFIFALLQFFVLPKDFLIQFGYSKIVSSIFDTTAPLTAYQLLGNSNLLRVQSSFAGPNQLASFALVIIFLAWGIIFSKKPSILAWISLVLAILVLILTFSRSAWIGFVAGMIILASFNLKKRPIFSGLIFGSLLILAILGFLLFRNQINDIIIRPTSSVWHAVALKDSWEAFRTHIFGLGLGKIGPASQWLQKPIISENYYLQIGLESGIFGLITFILAFVFLISDLKQKDSVLANSAICLIFSFLFASFFLHTLADGVLSFYIGLFLAIVQTKKER